MGSCITPVSDRSYGAICQDGILPEAHVSILNEPHQFYRDCLSLLDLHLNTRPLHRTRITSINGVAYDPDVEQDRKSVV